MQWITDSVKKEIREVFEPRYKHALSDNEVEDIAENLTGAMESILRFKWRQKYEKTI